MTLEINLENRKKIVASLRAEVIGPDPRGEVLSNVKEFNYNTFPIKQDNGQEIIFNEPVISRYGCGILFPKHNINFEEQEVSEKFINVDDKNTKEVDKDILEINKERKKFNEVDNFNSEDIDTNDVNLANEFKPSALGLSFYINLNKLENLKIEVGSFSRNTDKEIIGIKSGIYLSSKKINQDLSKIEQTILDKMYFRQELFDLETNELPSIIIPKTFFENKQKKITKSFKLNTNLKNLSLLIISRNESEELDKRLITVSLINRIIDDKCSYENCLFQSGIKVSNTNNVEFILPYSDKSKFSNKFFEDDQINELIYLDKKSFVVGHGCAADWDTKNNYANIAFTDFMPIFETPSFSPDLQITNREGVLEDLKISMKNLAYGDNEGKIQLEILINEYDKWIQKLISNKEEIEINFHQTANIIIEKCRQCLERIKKGFNLIYNNNSNPKIKRAFEMANHAMFLSQIKTESLQGTREPIFEGDKFSYANDIEEISNLELKSQRGFWRPFQIAFLLMSLDGIQDKYSDDREVVDLIWFPTGGGKTEAYLGLTAFTIFYRYLNKIDDKSVNVLMRYTLRLLTSQQFERASLLICSMEYLRKEVYKDELLNQEITIGLWVGSASTPNKRSDAVAKYNELCKDNKDADNPFILQKCPWCAAKFGKIKNSIIHGYNRTSSTTKKNKSIDFVCPDIKCFFGKRLFGVGNNLPIKIIDEDIYDQPTNLLISTVDKFAMLAWNPNIRKIFGINDLGENPKHSIDLIIQDEMHLISGPLGTMVGAYETLIYELSKSKDGYYPKIIGSTATISRAKEQIKNLYAKEKSFLFPPTGLNANDSFFSREKKNVPGRLYLGVLPINYSSAQTAQVRCYSSLMQFIPSLSNDPKVLDPWWTLLIYFNSIRELGGANTLFYQDIKERLRNIITRHGLDYSKIRKIYSPVELTSRIRDDEIPKILNKLQNKIETFDESKSLANSDVVDVCLASNIIEVGVDVARLSLMAIMGQPKSTSQYIQVSSRIGRDQDKPGLVLMLYSHTKPRDRSHYEKFKSYHQQIYSYVEPTSVTPFSYPALDRTIHALLVGYLRQKGDLNTIGENPNHEIFSEVINQDLLKTIKKVILDRVSKVNSESLTNVENKIDERVNQWNKWNPQYYGTSGNYNIPDDPPLLFSAGVEMPLQWNNHSWPTMTSMRNVDATCEALITAFYNNLEIDNEAD